MSINSAYVCVFLLLVVNNSGLFSCGIETRVRHMVKSHRQVKRKLVAIRRLGPRRLMLERQVVKFKWMHKAKS